MATETMNISLPDNLKRYVEERVSEDGYGNTSEYIRELIRKDREERRARAQERLEALLLEGIASGSAEPMGPDEWDSIRREIRERVSKLNTVPIPEA